MNYFSIKRPIFIVPSEKCSVEFEKIDKFMILLEKSGVGKIIEYVKYNDKNCKGRRGYNPYNLFAAIIYCFAKFNATLRDIEDKCIFDLRVLYIVEGCIPDHSTLGNFINNYIVPYQYEIFTCINKQIIKEFNLDISNCYVDGTKIEANANKYKFVWKPTKFHLKLCDKIRNLLSEYNLTRGLSKTGIISSQDIANKAIELNNILITSDLTIKDNKKHVKNYDLLVEYLQKSLEYEEKERICGPNRNSYYKTDNDATAMCLKEDYYSGLGSNMHAGYNTQISVINGLVSAYLVTQSRHDSDDFTLLLDKHYEFYLSYPKSLCADAGYGSYENYKYLDVHNIKNFVKYFTWQGNVSGQNPSQYRLDTNNETIICLNGNIGYKCDDVTWHHKKANSIFYRIEGCNNCMFSFFCKRFMKNKDENFKIFEVTLQLQKYIQEAEENLLSIEGIEMRVNRSSQVEGAFGVIKQDFQYERFRRRSLPKVSLEFMLVCLGYNIRKLFKYYDGNAKFDYWKVPKNITPEKFKKPSAKRLSKKASKIKQKSVNQEAKDNYKYAK